MKLNPFVSKLPIIGGNSLFNRSSFFAIAVAASVLITPALAQKPKQGAPSSQRGANTEAFIIGDSVPFGVANATYLGPADPNRKLYITVSLPFGKPEEMQAYHDAVSSPSSPLYRAFLTPAEIGQRFGVSSEQINLVADYLRGYGFNVTLVSDSRLGVTAEATVSQAEAAFGTSINMYQESINDAAQRPDGYNDPYTFFANGTPVHIPSALSGLVINVSGLENYTRPIPRFKRPKAISIHQTNGTALLPDTVRQAYNTNPMYNAATPLRGTGRTLGVSNFVPYGASDTPLFISHFALPTPAGGAASNISKVTISGGNSGSTNGEANLDVQMELAMAPLATIVIYDGGSNDLIGTLTKEQQDNNADIISESYGWNLPGSTLSAAHNIHVSMSTQGITYMAASGDSGSNLGSYVYPDDDPDVLMIGGTVMVPTSSGNINTETGWNGSGGGYSTQAASFNTLPSWQAGRGVPSGTNRRLLPDVSLHAAGAAGGAYQFYYNGGIDSSSIGTSFASPSFAGCLAIVEHYLIANNALSANGAGKRRLGHTQEAIYAMNGRNDVFRDTTSGNNGYAAGTKWDYVTGWGTPNFYNLAAAFKAPLSVVVSPSTANVTNGSTLQLTATVNGSNVTNVSWSIASGGGTVNSAGLYSAPASGATQVVVVKATSTIDTASPVYGSATLNVGCSSPISVTPTTLPDIAQNTTYNQTLSSSGGTGPYTYTVTVGSLPTGLNLNSSTGVISGTASANGTYNFTVQSTGTAGCPGTQAYTINVAPSTDLLAGGGTNTSTIHPGGQIAYTLTAKNLGPTTATNLVLTTAIPANTTFVSASAVTGTLSTPSVGGTGALTCTFSGNTNNNVTRTVYVTVQVNANAPIGADVALTSTVSSSTPESNPANNAVVAHTTVVNGTPVANSQSVTTNYNVPVNITVTASDPDNDPISYQITTAPAHGTLTGTAPNFTYTPNSGFSGADSFHFKVNDGFTDSNAATVNITVNGPTTVQFTGTLTFDGWLGAVLPTTTVSVDGGAPVSVTLSGSAIAATFTLPLSPNTTHTIKVHGDKYLDKKALVVTGTSNVSASFSLIGGDTNNDNFIDDTDQLAVINNFLSSDPSSDVNGDGIVDDTDLLYIINHFLSQGDV